MSFKLVREASKETYSFAFLGKLCLPASLQAGFFMLWVKITMLVVIQWLYKKKLLFWMLMESAGL